MKNSNTTLTVEETFARLQKQYSTINIKQINDLSPTKEDIVSTGIMGLDNALGVGGIKKGEHCGNLWSRKQWKNNTCVTLV